MARPKSSVSAESVDDITKDLISTLNKAGGGSDAYLQGEHTERTFGIKIPYLAVQWLLGGTNVIPNQRAIGISGLPKSFKSTLNMEIGNWYMEQGGIHVALDNEGKTSASMLDAMTRYSPKVLELAKSRRVFKETGSVEQWQEQVTAAIKYARKNSDRPAGSRIPIYVSIDSLNGKSSQSTQDKIAKEGSAEDRGFPVDAMKITRFFKSMSLLGTTMNIGYVQHLMQDLGAAPGYNGPVFKEAGAVIAAYQGSAQLRVVKGKALPTKATYFGAPTIGPPIEGYTLWITAERSCMGPDKRCVPVNILWQYVEKEDGSSEQVMWYDWDAALAFLLVDTQYAEKGYTSYEREKLKKVLQFSQPKTNIINCDELKLSGASMSEFGHSIRMNPEVSERLAKMLNIVRFPDVQQAELNLQFTEEPESE